MGLIGGPRAVSDSSPTEVQIYAAVVPTNLDCRVTESDGLRGTSFPFFKVVSWNHNWSSSLSRLYPPVHFSFSLNTRKCLRTFTSRQTTQSGCQRKEGRLRSRQRLKKNSYIIPSNTEKYWIFRFESFNKEGFKNKVDNCNVKDPREDTVETG